MIGKLSGIIDSFGDKSLILDVQGVGYIAYASSRTLTRLGSKGDPASLYIETQVREDAITLYGFIDAAEQRWFRTLNAVQGVGAKVALSILSACPPDRLQIIIAAQDKTALTQADGVGPKLALRILTELKDKVVAIESVHAGLKTEKQSITPQEDNNTAGIENDAISALINLGYARADAYTAIMTVKGQSAQNDNLQSLIRDALKHLSSS